MPGGNRLPLGADDSDWPRIDPMSAAQFAQMLERPLRHRTSPASGIHPEVAAIFKAAYAELVRVGEPWRRWRVSVAARTLTEMDSRSSQHSEITPEEAAELIKKTPSRVRQLLRAGVLPGRHEGRRCGDQVTVTRKDGKTAVFTITRVARFSKSRFPSQAVYGAIDHAGLRLITCAGTYDAASHRYLDNIVVFARLEAVPGPRG